ncbi:transporter substrate-binding domain-containing protein [Roseibium aggregatum]|uniref:Lysine-arginine-ornithine-binding periplasmic protein n=1 Tax=Roseibium aggregatum TaxID=187304 RepID=A0A0M6YBJ0_9HYPH|nr:transporter substrate-binding domain-containing protein [Roseibium aggregatum]CTQ47456.1 Lysine-arginine-ornithine-binding periplasmic protein precursor [Roseibium aggregatum]
MNKLQTIVAVFAVSVNTGAAAQEVTVRMGTEGYYPPFNYFDSAGQIKGFDIDIGNALCEKMKVKCEWVTTDWEGIIPALNANKFDTIVASMSITDERSKIVSFTEPYYFNPGQFVTAKDSGLKGAMPSDLTGKTIGTQSGTLEVKVLEQYFPESEIQLYPTLDDSLLDLETGRVDAVYASAFVLADWLATETGSCCNFVGQMFREKSNKGTGIAVRKDDEDLRIALNKALAEIMADGTYEEIRSRYFDFDIMSKPVLASELFK